MGLPCRWTDAGDPADAETVRFHRRFQKPRQLDDWERLWLVCEGADYVSRWSLNGHELGRHEGPFDPFEFDITSVVLPKNELTVELSCPVLPQPTRGVLPPGGGLWGTVALEVRRETFLRGLRLWSTLEATGPQLHAAGEVISDLARLVELYVLLDGRTLHYGQLMPGPFHVAVDADGVAIWPADPTLHEIKVELIDGAAKLDTQVRAFGFRSRINELPSDAHVVDLDRPVREWELLDQADLQGREIWVRLPFPHAALANCTAAVQELMYHPAVAGWVVGDEQVAHRVRVLDPARVVGTSLALRVGV
jgi:hypothetical protein